MATKMDEQNFGSALLDPSSIVGVHLSFSSWGVCHWNNTYTFCLYLNAGFIKQHLSNNIYYMSMVCFALSLTLVTQMSRKTQGKHIYHCAMGYK